MTPSPPLEAARSRAAGPDVPAWAYAGGALLLLAFVWLSIEAYAGASIPERVGVPSTGRERLVAGEALRAFYVPGETARIGDQGTGSRAQVRTLQPGDALLLGGSRKLVRLEAGGRLSPIEIDPGALVTVVNLGVWDPDAGLLGGLPAARTEEGWGVSTSSLPTVGPDLFPRGAREDMLGADFWLSPSASAGRIRRANEDGRPVVRLRANRSEPYLGIETAGSLPTLEDAIVTVRAVVRAKSGGTVSLTVFDTVDATGTLEESQERRPAREDGWIELTVRRRMTLATPGDKLSLGLFEPQSGDWIEIRELKTFLGASP